MTIVVPVAIPAPSLPVPDPADRPTFTTRKLEHLRWAKEDLAPGANALAAACYDNALDAQANALDIQAKAAVVALNVTAVANYANAQPWAAGTYALGVVVKSPGNSRLYEKITASSATVTDPKDDATNWKPVSPLLKNTTESRGTASIVSGVLALDLMNAIISVPLNANFTSITLANNLASASAVQSFTTEFVADGTARSGVWPAGNGTTTLLFKWPAGVAPTLTATSDKVDTFFFKSRSQFLWDAYIVGQDQ